jgi:hypothetical protein
MHLNINHFSKVHNIAPMLWFMFVVIISNDKVLYFIIIIIIIISLLYKLIHSFIPETNHVFVLYKTAATH